MGSYPHFYLCSESSNLHCCLPGLPGGGGNPLCDPPDASSACGTLSACQTSARALLHSFSGFDLPGDEPHHGMVCLSETCFVSHLAAGDKPGGQRGSLAPPHPGSVSCLFRDQPCGHWAVRHSIPRREGASSRRAVPLPDVNPHSRLYGSLDALWGAADVGFRFPGGVFAALEGAKLETRNGKFDGKRLLSEFGIPDLTLLVAIARPRSCLHRSEFHPRGLAGLLPGVDLPCRPMETQGAPGYADSAGPGLCGGAVLDSRAAPPGNASHARAGAIHSPGNVARGNQNDSRPPLGRSRAQ